MSFRGAPIILISIDTLRADHLPVYGYRAGSTPAIDRARRPASCSRRRTARLPLTLPSHTTLLTGGCPRITASATTSATPSRPPSAHSRAAQGRRLRDRRRGLLLRPAPPDRHRSRLRFFDDAIEITGTGESLSDTQRTAAHRRRARGLDRRPRQPAAVRLPPPLRAAHAVHAAGVARERAAVRRRDRLRGRDRRPLSRSAGGARYPRPRNRRPRLRSRRRARRSRRGRARPAAVREALHVPLILRLPGGAGGGRRYGPAALVDVAPTLLELAGAAADGVDGRSLVAALTARQRRRSHRLSGNALSAPAFRLERPGVGGRRPLPLHPGAAAELYDAIGRSGRSAESCGRKATTATALCGSARPHHRRVAVAPAGAADADVKERLRALGYTASSPRRAARLRCRIRRTRSPSTKRCAARSGWPPRATIAK